MESGNDDRISEPPASPRVDRVKYPNRLLDRFRDVNTDDSYWFREVYSDTERSMLELGFEVADCQFSGFWSQGDGASFTGSIVNYELFINNYLGAGPGDYLMIRKAASDGTIDSRLSRSGSNYAHSSMVGLDVTAELVLNYEQSTDPMMSQIYKAWEPLLKAELAEFETIAQAALRASMDMLYDDLETAYEYLTSDEAIADWIAHNLSDEDLASELADLDDEDQ